MPTLTPIDIYGNFRSGYADGRGDLAERMARDGRLREAADLVRRYDPSAASAYEARDQRDAGEAYGRLIASGNYEKAQDMAGQRGDLEGFSAIRQMRQQISQEERRNTWRVLRSYNADLQAIEAMPEGERQSAYEQLLNRARSEAAQSPEGDASWLDQLPAQWSPQLSANLQGRINRVFEELLDPEELAELEQERLQNDRQQLRDDRRYEIDQARLEQGERRLENAIARSGDRDNSANVRGERDLRREFDARQGDFRQVRDSYAQIETLATNPPSAAGDLSFVFSYMKMLDPGSVVREGEFANAQNAAGVPDQVRNLYNRVRTGQRLNTTQREDFRSQAQSIYETRLRQFERDAEEYRALAQDYGYEPSRVVVDQALPQTNRLPPIAERVAGQRYQMADGGSAEWNGSAFINHQRPQR